MLSRLHRRAEALDEACLRALGHPNDHAIREELLSALEWEPALSPHHAGPSIRERFHDVYERSRDLARHLRAAEPAPGNGHHPVRHGIESLRGSLAGLSHILAHRHKSPPE